MSADMGLKGNAETGWYVEDAAGGKSFPNTAMISRRLAVDHGALGFDVLYIGQAFGDDGSRNALDRLKKHETLQKIAAKVKATGVSTWGPEDVVRLKRGTPAKISYMFVQSGWKGSASSNAVLSRRFGLRSLKSRCSACLAGRRA
jgi:hypothetical protein